MWLWLSGTELRHTPLHDPLIQTPLGLKLALSNPYLRQHYVLSANITDAIFDMAQVMPGRDRRGHVILSPVGGRRRIDCVLYRKGDGVVGDTRSLEVYGSNISLKGYFVKLLIRLIGSFIILQCKGHGIM